MLLATFVTNNEMNTSALANFDIKLYVIGTLKSVKSCEITLCSSMFMVNSQFFMVNSPLLVKGLNSPWFTRAAEAFVASLLCLCCWIFSASARELEQPLLDAGR